MPCRMLPPCPTTDKMEEEFRATGRDVPPWLARLRAGAQRMDHRTVPLEVLREFARSYAELTSLRTVAEDAGVGRSTVHSFITTEKHTTPARTTPAGALVPAAGGGV